MEDERRVVRGENSRLQATYHDGEDACNVRDELLVVTGDLGPPWVYVGSLDQRDEIIQFKVESRVRRRRGEKRWEGIRRAKRWE